MNKLEVALKLLQLLNERKVIDSRVVAHELNVSLRTAQRYLIELSILPCISYKQSSHSYSLNADYQLNEALKIRWKSDSDSVPKPEPPRRTTLHQTLCLACGNNPDYSYDMSNINLFSKTANISNISKIDRLTVLISKRLKNPRCSFPSSLKG